MPNLNLDLDYFDHPKVRRLVALLQASDADVYPIRLWCYCGKYHVKDGVLRGYSDNEIEGVLRWIGKPGELVNALVTVGLLEGEKGALRVHDWKSTNGHLIVFKKRASVAAKARWGNASSIAKRHVEQSPNQPYQPTIPNQVKKERPTPEDVKTYFRELECPYEAEKFFDHFQSNGWKVGGKAPMKDWKSAARNWKRRGMEKGTIKLVNKSVAKTCKDCGQTFEDEPKYYGHVCPKAVPPPKEFLDAMDKLANKMKV